ncbi:MAG: ATP-binding protein [Burkholderiales bacterium]|nr:ATP-binding protein [Burkholderiales bacterium]
MAKRVILSWSSGKDSAWALHVLRADPNVQLLGLVCTLNEAFDRVAMHGVRRALVEAQARAAGLPLRVLPLPWPCPNETYEAAMRAFARAAAREGATHLAFGDLYLDDVRRYRERLLEGTGLRPLFPLWGRETRALAAEMTAAGLRARIVCVDPRQAPREWAGRLYDPAFVAALPPAVDACGERGEFHTFAFAGPMFSEPVAARAGDTIERDGFVWADLLAV